MRIGLAGTGRIGAFHASTLAALEQVEQVVVTDAFPETAERLAAESGYEFAADLDYLLDRVDGLVITTSTDAHAATLRRGVEAGVTTFCEKPVARTLEETVELVELVEKSDVRVHVGFQRRFDEGYRRAREAVRSGELGFLHTVRANTHDQAPPPAALHPHQRRAVPGLQHPRLRHPAVRHRPRGGQRVRDRRQQGCRLLRRGRRRRHGGRGAHAGRRHPRLGHGHPLQRRRSRRPDGAQRVRGHRSASGTTTRWRSGRRRPVSTTRRGRRSGPTWSGSCRPTVPS